MILRESGKQSLCGVVWSHQLLLRSPSLLRLRSGRLIHLAAATTAQRASGRHVFPVLLLKAVCVTRQREIKSRAERKMSVWSCNRSERLLRCSSFKTPPFFGQNLLTRGVFLRSSKKSSFQLVGMKLICCFVMSNVQQNIVSKHCESQELQF